MKNGIIFLFATIVVVIIFVFVMQLPHNESIFMTIAGNTAKLEVIKLIGWGISGIIAVLSVYVLFERTAALDKQNKLIEQGHVQDRFKAAIEHLGNERVSTRIAAFYEFYHLGKIATSLHVSIFDILCLHLQQTTKENYLTSATISPEPTTEVQSLLNILFKRRNRVTISKKNEQRKDSMAIEFQKVQIDMFKHNDIFINLERVNLQMADLQEADLEGVNLQSAILRYAYLQGANLQKADLQGANLQGANLQKADLQEADLQRAYLQEANLQGANLQKADLQEADLQEADLQRAYLQEANLQEADLQRAYLQEANLQGANLQKADLQGAKINKNTTIMPPNWENVVKKDAKGELGVIYVED